MRVVLHLSVLFVFGGVKKRVFLLSQETHGLKLLGGPRCRPENLHRRSGSTPKPTITNYHQKRGLKTIMIDCKSLMRQIMKEKYFFVFLLLSESRKKYFFGFFVCLFGFFSMMMVQVLMILDIFFVFCKIFELILQLIVQVVTGVMPLGLFLALSWIKGLDYQEEILCTKCGKPAELNSEIIVCLKIYFLIF